MNDLLNFIESGVLELYVLGQTSPEETKQVEYMASMYEEVGKEIEAISIALERYAEAHAIEPGPTAGLFLMASINYSERMKHGEAMSFPPMLHEGSKIEDYSEWLNREDLQLNEELDELHAHIIGYTPEMTTAIIWIKRGAPPEHHNNEHEKFLIVEGSCKIYAGDDVYEMHAGDYFSMPLHVSHNVKVTSAIPCKVILQRIAA